MPRRVRVERPLQLLAMLLALAAAIAALVQLPRALHDLQRRADLNARQSPIGRQIAGADAMEIDNEFLVEALSLLPRDARYAILRPDSLDVAKTYSIVPTTYNALPAFVQNVLLPRRQVDAQHAQYVLCYACNTDPFDARMHRLWQDPHGLVIGKLR